jgi:16S rRNA (guanine(966)-N(2))-methyltransferase RsmD
VKARQAAPSPRPARRVARELPREVRVIGGSWKRSKLPVADRPGLRPTPDRVRETLFNWLGQALAGWRCVDAFAGSGALGFEAASRGAAEVVLLERDPVLVASLVATKERLQAAAIRVERADALQWLGRAPAGAFDLVFLDPPFDSALLAPALLAAERVVAGGGLIYLEGPAPLDPAPGGPLLEPWRAGRAGAVHFQLLRKPAPG